MDANDTQAAHPKTVRRRILEVLYGTYMRDPLEMPGPEAFTAQGITRQELIANIHYLADRNFVELMMGYAPPLFASARIRPDGIDLVENRYEFNRLFPPAPGELEAVLAGVPRLLEELMVQAELSPLDGDARQALLRDVDFLRAEVARPAHRWRHDVIETILGWVAANFDKPEDILPALPGLRAAITQAAKEA
jgi:hypothetical protein